MLIYANRHDAMTFELLIFKRQTFLLVSACPTVTRLKYLIFYHLSYTCNTHSSVKEWLYSTLFRQCQSVCSDTLATCPSGTRPVSRPVHAGIHC